VGRAAGRPFRRNAIRNRPDFTRHGIIIDLFDTHRQQAGADG
jgi:hypothetical protein